MTRKRGPVQRTEDWYAARRLGVTSTDIVAILGISPYSSEGDVAREKQSGERFEDPEHARRLRLGAALEDAVAREDEFEHGFKLRRFRRMVTHPTIPWALASLDYERVGERTIVETKTSASPRWDDELPRDVEAQVRWQMGVTGYPRAHVAALRFGRDLVCHDVEHDEATFRGLVAIGADFLRRLEAGGPFAETRASARRAWPRDSGEEVTPDPQTADAVRDLLETRRALKALEGREDALVAAIETRMADASTMTGFGWRITWRRSADSSSTAWDEVAGAYRAWIEEHRPAKKDDLDAIVELYTETKPGARRFILREERDF